MIGVTHIGTVTVQGTEEERREMLRAMGEGLTHPDTHEVERLIEAQSHFAAMLAEQEDRADKAEAERDALQARVAELEAALAAQGNAEWGEA